MKALAGKPQLLPPSIDHIPHDGMVLPCQMYPDLMGAPCFQPQPQVGIARIAGDHFIVSDRRTAVFLRYRHLFPVYGMPPNGCVNGAGIRPHTAHYDRLVDPGKGVILQLLCQCLMGKIVFCHDQQAAGIHIDPRFPDAAPR